MKNPQCGKKKAERLVQASQAVPAAGRAAWGVRKVSQSSTPQQHSVKAAVHAVQWAVSGIFLPRRLPIKNLVGVWSTTLSFAGCVGLAVAKCPGSCVSNPPTWKLPTFCPIMAPIPVGLNCHSGLHLGIFGILTLFFIIEVLSFTLRGRRLRSGTQVVDSMRQPSKSICFHFLLEIHFRFGNAWVHWWNMVSSPNLIPFVTISWAISLAILSDLMINCVPG